MKLLVYFMVLIAAAISMANLVERKITEGDVLICTGPSGTGYCFDKDYKFDTCYDLPGNLTENAATFAPLTTDFYCDISLSTCGSKCKSTPTSPPTDCPQVQVGYYSPEKYNLTSMFPGWDRLIKSFTCREGTPAP